MFKRLAGSPGDRVTIHIDGVPFQAHTGDSVAAAVLASGRHVTRTTPVSGAPRAPVCLMGVCHECLMVIDGRSNRRACREIVADGMRVETQHGVGTPPA